MINKSADITDQVAASTIPGTVDGGMTSLSERRHLLTVALEDYFQVGSFNTRIQRRQWYRFEPRLERNTLTVLNLLERHNAKATFFILGWIADQYPEIIKMVAERGHEIASKGYYHRSIRQMTPEEFREDLARSREALEAASGKKVRGYRVAHEWFSPRDLWALDILADEGYAYDSSIGLIFRRFALQPWRRFVHKHQFGEKQLWEFPLSSLSFLGWHVPIAGGNYFRQFPHTLVKRAVEHWHRTHPAPFVMYFHVWELDPEQPKINAVSLLTRIRHYRNLNKMSWVLEDYLGRYRFTGMADYLGLSLDKEEWSGNNRFPEVVRARLSGSQPALLDTARPGEVCVKTDVSVIVPCFNEELVLPYLANTLKSVQRALANHYDLHFFFVDDGSADATLSSLHDIFGSWPNCKVLQHERNLGVAAAILTGIRHADSEIVSSIDCDCTYDPHELEMMIPLLTEDVDLVTASPYHPEGRVRNVPNWRLWLSKSSSFLYRCVLRQKLFTYTSCFRVYRRSAFAEVKLEENGYLGIAEMLARIDLRGSKIAEYPTTLEVRTLGRSKMRILRTIVGHLRILARLLALRILVTSGLSLRGNSLADTSKASLTPPGSIPTCKEKHE